MCVGRFQDKANLLMAYKVDKRSRATNNNSDSYEFTNANRMFVDTELRVRQCLLDVLAGEIDALVINHRAPIPLMPVLHHLYYRPIGNIIYRMDDS